MALPDKSTVLSKNPRLFDLTGGLDVRFFQANGIYIPNPTGAQDFRLGVLGITMGLGYSKRVMSDKVKPGEKGPQPT